MTVEITDSLAGIRITAEGKVPIKRIDFVHEEDRVRTLHDPARLQILQILKEGIEDTVTQESFDESTGERLIRQKVIHRTIMSVNEIIRVSEDTDRHDALSKSQIYHHIPKLIDAGFVLKHGIIKKGKRSTDYYRRTAGNFVTYGLHYDPEKYKEVVYSETKESLSVFNLDFSDSEKEELLELMVEAEVMRLKWAKFVEGLVKDDITESKAVELFEWFLWIYASGDNEYMKLISKIREKLFGD